MPAIEPSQKNNPPAYSQSELSTLEQLMRENLELTREIAEQSKKTKRYILFGQVLNVVKVVLIIGPIIVALIYLPPLITQWFSAYSDLLGGGTGQTILEGNSFINTLFGKTFSQ